MQQVRQNQTPTLFITLSLGLAFFFNMLPISELWWPDILAVVLVYWVLYYPSNIGMGIGFLLGLVMDVQDGSVMGQHAITYVLLSFLVLMYQRRLLWFAPWSQALQLLPVFFLPLLLTLFLRLWLGGLMPNITIFITPFLQALLWLPISWFFMLVHRRLEKTQAF
jgi:rod shape-determining protein MreD